MACVKERINSCKRTEQTVVDSNSNLKKDFDEVIAKLEEKIKRRKALERGALKSKEDKMQPTVESLEAQLAQEKMKGQLLKEIIDEQDAQIKKWQAEVNRLRNLLRESAISAYKLSKEFGNDLPSKKVLVSAEFPEMSREDEAQLEIIEAEILAAEMEDGGVDYQYEDPAKVDWLVSEDELDLEIQLLMLDNEPELEDKKADTSPLRQGKDGALSQDVLNVINSVTVEDLEALSKLDMLGLDGY